jgi:hypothetical protein
VDPQRQIPPFASLAQSCRQIVGEYTIGRPHFFAAFGGRDRVDDDLAPPFRPALDRIPESRCWQDP